MEWINNRGRNNKIKELLASGESISYISRTIGCSKSTVHYYATKYGLNHNNKVKDRIARNALKSSIVASIAANKIIESKRKLIIEEAIKEWTCIKIDSKMMMFLGLYWGEGCKRSGYIGVVNNDPGIIKICYDIISKVGNVCVDIRCYPEQNHDECKEFWSKLLDCNVKVKDKKWLGKKRKTWSKYGICSIRTNNMEFYLRIITWISLMREETTNLKHIIDPSISIARSGLYQTIDYK